MKTLGIGYILWNALYITITFMPMKLLLKPDDIKLSKIDELDVRNRIVSIVHGIMIVVFATYHFFL